MAVAEPKSFIFRYYAEVDHDKYFCDDGEMADPDFFSNRHDGTVFPTWSICGVYHRRDLRKGYRVFFLPARVRLDRKGIGPYICTGVLVVDEVLPGKEELLRDRRISEQYKELYETDLREHLKEDKKRNKPLTEKLRPQNIIIGDPEESIWFGQNDVDFSRVLRELGIGRISRVLSKRNNRNLPTLTSMESTTLYEYLKRRLPAVKDPFHNHYGRKSGKACTGCTPR